MPGETQIPLEPEPIYSRKKGEQAEVIATYDAEFRAGFDRKITDWAIDFMTRAQQDGKPFYVYLPYTQVHIPPIPDPEYAGKTKRGNFADLLIQMDDFTGRILDTLDELGLGQDTIVVWSSDNGADPNYRMPAMDPDPFGGQWAGFSGPWRGGYFTSLEGSNRAPCLIRWPGKVPAGKVSNELVHLVDTFTTLLLAAGAKVPDDRQIDGMDMRDFLLGDAEESGRDTILCIQGNRLQAVKWRQWKAHLFEQDAMLSTWTPYNVPHLHNLEWDPREEHEVDFPHAWVVHPMAAAVARVHEDARDRAADQARNTRPLPAAQARRAAPRGAHPARRHHPVRDHAREVPSRSAATAYGPRAPVGMSDATRGDSGARLAFCEGQVAAGQPADAPGDNSGGSSISRLRILPVGPFGSSGSSQICRGYL